jgi:hypothetical protein
MHARQFGGSQIRQRPLAKAGVIRLNCRLKRSAVVGTGCNARNVRTIKADIGQFAIAKLGQFADIALIVPERLDHADEREQHGSLLVFDSALAASFIVEMNVDQNVAMQKIEWCGAANQKMHGKAEGRLTIQLNA